jgi:hypothetical protein
MYHLTCNPFDFRADELFRRQFGHDGLSPETTRDAVLKLCR